MEVKRGPYTSRSPGTRRAAPTALARTQLASLLIRPRPGFRLPPSRRKGLARLLALFSFLVLAVPCILAQPGAGRAEDRLPSEAQVKAAFLLNFPKYVEWPETTFAAADSPIVIAIFGEEDVSAEFRRMSEGKVISGRPVVFRRIESEERCDASVHILFIGDSEHRRAQGILERLRASHVLTVGENPDFIENGGIINLARRDRKIRLEVNLPAAQGAGLKISSKLLSVADVVKGQKPN